MWGFGIIIIGSGWRSQEQKYGNDDSSLDAIGILSYNNVSADAGWFNRMPLLLIVFLGVGG